MREALMRGVGGQLLESSGNAGLRLLDGKCRSPVDIQVSG